MSSASWQRLLYPGLLLFGLSLPLSKSASTLLLGVLILSAVAGALASREFRDDIRRSCRQPLTAAFAFFCLVAYVGVIHTEKYSDGFGIANKLIFLPVIYFFVSVLLQIEPDEDARNRKAEFLLISFLLGLTALDLIGVLTFLGAVGDAPASLPVSPLGLHHIWFSNINALGLYTALSFLRYSRYGTTARGKVLLCCFLLLSVLCILLSTSRTAWLGIALTAAIMASVVIKSKKTVVRAALLAALALTAVYLLVPFVQDRINLVAQDMALFTANPTAESSIGDRLLLWKASLLMFKSRPVLGVGTGDFLRTMKVLRRDKLVPRRLLRFNQPHNMYLFSLATNGIAGLSAILYVFYRILRSVKARLRFDGKSGLFVFLALATAVHFLIAGFMDSFFNIQILRYAFAFIMGVCLRNSVSGERQAGETN